MRPVDRPPSAPPRTPAEQPAEQPADQPAEQPVVFHEPHRCEQLVPARALRTWQAHVESEFQRMGDDVADLRVAMTLELAILRARHLRARAHAMIFACDKFIDCASRV